SAGRSESRDPTGARGHRATETTARPKAARLVPGLARHPGVGNRHRRAAGAHPHQRGKTCLAPAIYIVRNPLACIGGPDPSGSPYAVRSHPPFVHAPLANMATGVEATLAAARRWRAKRNDVLGAMKMK